MAEESTINVRGLWDQKPGTVKVPASIAKICHDFSKEQTIVVRRPNSSEDSATFEPFTPVIISVREREEPTPSEQDSLRWSSERTRKLLSSTGESLRQDNERGQSFDNQRFGFYLLLGYVLMDKEREELDILAGPVHDSEDPFMLLKLEQEDVKRLNGFYIGGKPCTNPPWTFFCAWSLIRCTSASFKLITYLQPTFGQVVVGAEDACSIAWQDKFLLPAKEELFHQYRAKMLTQYYSHGYEEYCSHSFGLDRRHAVEYKLFYKLCGGDEVLAYQLFYRNTENTRSSVSYHGDAGEWNLSYLNTSTYGQDLENLTSLERSVLGSNQWKDCDARISVYNKLSLIRARSINHNSCPQLPFIATSDDMSKFAFEKLSRSDKSCLSRVVPEFDPGSDDAYNPNDEARVLHTGNVIQVTCVGHQLSARSTSYSMVLIAKVADTHLLLLKEQGTSFFFVFNVHGTESLLQLSHCPVVESDDDYYFDDYPDSDRPEEPRYDCSICNEETKSSEDASDADSKASSSGLRVGTVPLGCLTWLEGYDPNAGCKVQVKRVEKAKLASASQENLSSCEVTLHDVHQGTFHVRYLASVEEMAQHFRTDYVDSVASTSQEEVSLTKGLSEANLDPGD